jgi:signal peptidase I
LLIATLLPGLVGYERYVLVGGSMEPAIHRGSLVFDRVVPVSDLRVGDVITYVRPGTGDAVTHRIVRDERGPRGERVFRTQGDANRDSDLQPFTLDGPTQARVAFSVPYLGYIFIFLASQQARLFLLVLPAIVLALLMVARLWRDAGRMLEQQQ